MPDRPLLATYLLGVPPLLFAVVYAVLWSLLWPVMLAIFIAQTGRDR